MHYKVKEIYYTLQGEGFHSGRPAVFCRFMGCNLWTGREEDRHKAICQFCDTDFIGPFGVNGGRFTSEELADNISSLWPAKDGHPFVVFTGGEPLLQLDEELIAVCHKKGIEVAVETNGTIPVPSGIDWVCISPKAGSDIVVTSGNEIKIVYPQVNLDPLDFEKYQFEHYYIQPLDDPNQEANIQASIQFCLDHPQWKLSLQSHKIIGIL